jgi:hypothetical protein
MYNLSIMENQTDEKPNIEELKEQIIKTSGEAVAATLLPYYEATDNSLALAARPKSASLTPEAWINKVKFTIEYYASPQLSYRKAEAKTGTSGTRNGVIARETLGQLHKHLSSKYEKEGLPALPALEINNIKKGYKNK